MRATLVLGILILPLALFGGDNTWSSHGPLGGTFPTITFHPTRSSVIFAGSFDGLYRSTDTGATWLRLEIQEGESEPVNVRFASRTSEDVFASTAAFLFHSTDMGNNWQVVSKLPVEFADFEFHPSNPNILYAVSFNKGVYRSGDGGRTWVTRNTGLQLAPKSGCCDIPQLEVDPRNGDVVYILLASRIAYRSSNGGSSWTALKALSISDEVRSLVIDPKNPDTLYSGSGDDGVSKSTNGGAAWSPLNCNCSVAGIALDPNKTQTIFAAGSGGLRRSLNGGTSWVTLTRTQFSGVQVSPVSGNLLVLGGDGGGLYRSQNGGSGIQLVNNHVDAIAIRHLSSTPQRPATIFGQGDFQVYRSRNAGATWELWRFGHNFDMRDIQVHPKNPDVVAAAGLFPDMEASLAVSVNGGSRWELRGPPDADGADVIAMAPDNDKVFYIAPLSGEDNLGIARSMDQGRTWKYINSGITNKAIDDIVVDPLKSAIVYAAAYSGQVFKSTNAGDSWKNSSTGLRGGVIHSLEIDPGHSETLYAATAHGIYKSINAGQNWALKSKGISPGLELWFVRCDPTDPQIVYSGFEDSLFVSVDGGENWSAFDTSGLARFSSTDLLINAAQPSVLHLAVNRGEFSFNKVTVTGGPELLQLLPSSGKSGATITIEGRNFGASQGSGKIFFGSSDAGTAVSWSESRIVTHVPSSAQTGPVSVQIGSAKSNTLQFVVQASSGAIQPSTGPSGGGTLVTVISPTRASGFSFVLFGDTFAKGARFVPPNTIVCTTPPGSGPVDVVIVSTTSRTTVGTYTYQ